MRIALASVVIGLLFIGGCFDDATNETGSGTGETECEGAVGCSCYPNGTCDAALACFADAQLCIPDNCSPIVAGCPCPADGCGGGLVCEGPVCVAEGATSGSSTGASGTTASGSESTASSTAADSTGASDTRSVTLYFSSEDTPFSSGLGPLATRTEADILCAAVRLQANPECENSVALISASDSDSVRTLDERAQLPFAVPVDNTDGGEVGASIQHLLDNGAKGPLSSLGVRYADAQGVPAFYWTGSGLMGEFHPSCDEWTSLTSTGKGVDPSISNQYWLSGNDFDCGTSAPLLCACWN